MIKVEVFDKHRFASTHLANFILLVALFWLEMEDQMLTIKDNAPKSNFLYYFIPNFILLTIGTQNTIDIPNLKKNYTKLTIT